MLTLAGVEVDESAASVDIEAAADDDCHVDVGVARVTRRRRMCMFKPLDKMPMWDIMEALDTPNSRLL